MYIHKGYYKQVRGKRKQQYQIVDVGKTRLILFLKTRKSGEEQAHLEAIQSLFIQSKNPIQQEQLLKIK